MTVAPLPPDSAPRSMKTFFIIWIGQLISIFGSSLTAFGLGVWTFQKTGQATPFAITVLFASLPRVLLTPLAGSVADRFNRRRVMIIADTGAAVVTLGIALVLTFGELQLWHIYAMAAIGSAFAAFQEPAYMASVTMIVPKEHLGRASGLTNTAQSISVILAPAAAAALYAVIGLRGLILLDFVSAFFAIGTLMAVRIPQPVVERKPGERHNALMDARDGWRYVLARQGLFGLLVMFSLANFMLNVSFVLLTPLVLGFANVRVLGIIQSTHGVAMLVGSLLMASWGGPKRRASGILTFMAISGLGTLIVGLQPSALLIAAGFAIAGLCLPLAGGSSQAIWQSKVEPAIQGRVFSIRVAIAQALMPLAFLSAGWLADQVFEPLMAPGGALAATLVGELIGTGPGRGAGLIFILAGLGLLASVALAWANPRVRHVERELPDVITSTGVEETSPLAGAEQAVVAAALD